MSDTSYIQDIVRKKFKGKSKLKSKVHLHYKANLEREYERVIERYYAILLDALQTLIEEIFAAPSPAQDRLSGFRVDDTTDDFINYIKSAFRKADKTIQEKQDLFDLQGKIDKMAKLTQKLSVSEWKRVVKKTLGIDILDDYYSGAFYSEQLQRWTEDNVNLIKTLPQDALDEMQRIVEDGFRNGRLGKDIVKEIQQRYKASKSQALFYAVDQMAKLNAAIAKQQQQDAGVEEYEWSTSGDQRVRERHRELDGTIHRWDEPPIVDKKTGRRCHPGEDYRCRCVAIPIFKLEGLELPIKIEVKGKGG